MTTSTGPAAEPVAEPVDLLDPELLGDPFTGYGRIREQAPLVRARFPGAPSDLWLATRYDDVRAVLADPRFSVDPGNVPGGEAENMRAAILRSRGITEEYAPYITGTILDLDGADHTRLRKLVSRTFTVRRVNDLRPRVERITADLLDALPGAARDGVVDLIEEFAYPLPITVICELVGIPEEYRPQWREWGRDLVSLEQDGRFPRAVAAIVDHVRGLIEERRGDLGDDLLSGLIRVRDDDGGRLSDTELVTMVLTLVVAGHETTAHLIGNGTAALLTHPDQRALWAADPDLGPRAVHELMRWCGPVQGTRMRYATEDVAVGGMPVRRGEAVMAVLVGANFDPDRFPEPERLDLTREPAGRRESHVGFSHGVHYCLGAALARQEGEVALGALLRRYPDLAPAVPPEELVRQPMPASWRLDRLPVRLG
ncbi:cytochrome P450 family protein [Nocardiopsis trehalosi]|uniref:cytochrome P450 family protein n=1 Tax=Nocardiopsis trehalosi TaxID=109329 RepID=UPI0008360515|nr:cytochrome P450 [Nocardiopsis trehalosi]